MKKKPFFTRKSKNRLRYVFKMDFNWPVVALTGFFRKRYQKVHGKNYLVFRVVLDAFRKNRKGA